MATAADAGRARVAFRIDGAEAGSVDVTPGQTADSAGRHSPSPDRPSWSWRSSRRPGEVSTLNNRAAVVVNGVRDRLRVLLVSGQPHPGRTHLAQPAEVRSGGRSGALHHPAPAGEGRRHAAERTVADRLPGAGAVRGEALRFRPGGLRPLRRARHPAAAYYGRIADYVRHGGALLVAVGPGVRTAQSLFRTPLGEVLPARPTGRVVERAFRPQVTDVGQRHPVTSGLPGERPSGDSEAEPSRRGPDLGPLVPPGRRPRQAAARR